mmetsp:Transcript_15669/g.33931  ORF Transcript_15669/g.33931 Transcript_15669/m.33931 type:complete len:473 (-) Transcript_15669:125-1543(-)
MVNGTGQTIAGVMGNVLEWYDFALFGFFSDVIAKVFFAPSDTPDTNSTGEYYDGNLMKSFAVYGGAFLMRPFGGMVIGYLGDKYGRKYALVLSLFLMAVPTFVMGCLPTYEQVGSLSTVLLVLCRLLQGMSVGGQLPASLIYTVETRPKEKWGLYGSLVMMAANIGTLLGNFVGAVLRSILTEEQLLSWGWRIPFWSGILIAGVAMYLKLHGEEHHPNAGEYDTEDTGDSDAEPVRPKHPLRESFRRENMPALISATLVPMLWGAGFYVTFVWMAIYMNDMINPPIENAFWINAMALLFGVTLPLPLMGLLSDYIGRVKIMVAGAVGLGCFGPILLWVIASGDPTKAFFAQWGIGILLTLYGGPISAWLVERFPPKVRLTSAALGYDLAHCTASAFSPLVATVLVQKVSLTAPGIIYPFFAILGLMGMFISTKIHQDGGVDDIQSNSSVGNDVELKEEESEGGEERKINPIV